MAPQHFDAPRRGGRAENTTGQHRLGWWQRRDSTLQFHAAALRLEVPAELHQGQIGQAAVDVDQQHRPMGQTSGGGRRRTRLRLGDGQSLWQETARETAPGAGGQGKEKLVIGKPTGQQPDEGRLVAGRAPSPHPITQHDAGLSQWIAVL
jgi:hypothetical protein